MQAMATLLQRGHAPAEVMASSAAKTRGESLYRPCPCGSGRKFSVLSRQPRAAPGAHLTRKGKGHGTKRTKHSHSLGDDIGLEYQPQQPGLMGYRTPNNRPRRQRSVRVHGLGTVAELYCGTCAFITGQNPLRTA